MQPVADHPKRSRTTACSRRLPATARASRCAAIAHTVSPRISGEELEEILEVSRLTRAERQKGPEHGGKAGGVGKAQNTQTRKSCIAR
jgi:hypothetical protein